MPAATKSRKRRQRTACSALAVIAATTPVAFGPDSTSCARADILQAHSQKDLPGTSGISPGPGVDLSQWNTDGHSLDFADFRSDDLEAALFTDSDLRHALFTAADLAGADFSGAVLSDASIKHADISGTVFASASGFTYAELHSSASYAAHDLQNITFDGLNLKNWNFSKQDLAGASFDGTTLKGVNFSGANLAGVDLSSASVATGINFSGADLVGTVFGGNQFKNSNFSRADLAGDDFSGAALMGANFKGADLAGVTLAGADIKGAHFAGADLANASLNDMNFTGFDLSHANLTGANLTSAELDKANLSHANAAGADFEGTDLTHTNFTAANLSDANFIYAVLSSTNFSRANLIGANFSSVHFDNPNFAGATITGADFSGSKGFYADQLYSTASYAKKNLSGINFSSFLMFGWNLSGQNLSGANFSEAVLNPCNLANANLSNANFSFATFTNPVLSGATIAGANLTSASGFTQDQLYSTGSYTNHDLHAVNLTGLDLSGWDLSGQNLAGAIFSNGIAPVANSDNSGVNGIGGDTVFTGSGTTTLGSLGVNVGSGGSVSFLSGSLSLNNNILNTIGYSLVLQGNSTVGTSIQLGTISFSNGVSLILASGNATQFSDGILLLVDGSLTLGSLTLNNASGGTATLTTGSLNFGGTPLLIAGADEESLKPADAGAAPAESGILITGGGGPPSPVAASVGSANFSNAIIAGANFSGVSTFSSSQLYSTASYINHDLHGIVLSYLDLSNWNFTSQNLAAGNFTGSTLTSANFSDADLRGAVGFSPVESTITRNTILPDGSIHGLALGAGETLTIRNNALPITVDTAASFDPQSTLQFLLSANWTSPVGFSGFTPALGGTLDLEIAPGVDPASLAGETFQLFDWNSAPPAGDRFSAVVTDPGFTWDLLDLYTDGTVSIVADSEPAGAGAAEVPEPAAFWMLILPMAGLLLRRRRPVMVVLPPRRRDFRRV